MCGSLRLTAQYEKSQITPGVSTDSNSTSKWRGLGFRSSIGESNQATASTQLCMSTEPCQCASHEPCVQCGREPAGRLVATVEHVTAALGTLPAGRRGWRRLTETTLTAAFSRHNIAKSPSRSPQPHPSRVSVPDAGCLRTD